MVPLPPPPKPHVDPHALPALLDQRLLDEVLLPHCPRTVSNRTDEGATVCWTVELELWFQTFEPSVWQMLSEDEEADYKWLMAVTERCGLYDEELGKPVAEEAKLEGAQGEQFTIVRERYRQRFLRLQALAWMRAVYLSKQQEQDRDLAAADVTSLTRLPSSGSAPIPQIPMGTVWPLPAEPPRPNLVKVTWWNVAAYMVPFCPILSP